MSNVTNDPVADMLTRIRNALTRGKPEVIVPKSKIKLEIARILKEEGYIEDFTVGDESPVNLIKVQLKYFGTRRDRRPVITQLQRVSKPGRRVYRKAQRIADCIERHRHRHRYHAKRRHDRAAGATRRRWRRSALLRLVGSRGRRHVSYRKATCPAAG